MKTLKLQLGFVAALFLSVSGFAQAPESMSYQAVIRNAANALVASTPVSMKVSILQGTANGTAVFVETQTASTNANGLVSIAIGSGTAVTGTVGAIDWANGPYFIKTETDPAGGSNYTITSTTQLLSVPYALHAKSSSTATQGMTDHAGNSVNCLDCHNHNPATAGTSGSIAQKLAEIKREIEHSKHAEGVELAIEEGSNSSCAPCHSHEGFSDVVSKGTIPAYTLNTGTGKYTFSYNASASASSSLSTMPNAIGCFTCHKGAASDNMALATTDSVPMVMHSMPTGKLSINLTQKGGISNLCVKCHQPRTMNTSSTLSTGAAVDYAGLAAAPTAVFYDSAVGNKAPNKLVPSYRTHNHYGTVGAIFAGKGGVEIPGSLAYKSSKHTTVATCQDCHMATPTATAGAHSFKVGYVTSSGSRATNFKGCNITGCHSSAITSTTSAFWTSPRTEIQGLLVTLAGKLKSGTVEIMHKNTASDNIFAHVTTQGYDGYLDIYDPSTNPDGAIQNPAPSGSWTATQKSTNLALPKLTSLTNAQMGAIINFQFCLREYSLGIHNFEYSKALLQNSIEALTAQGL